MAYAQEDRVPAPLAATPRLTPVVPPELPPAAVAGPVRSLRDAVLLAYWSNPTLLSQRATVRSTDYRLPAARAALGFTLTLQASHAFQRDRTDVPSLGFTGNQGWSSVATAIANQPLFTFGRAAGGERVALAQIAFSRDTLRLTETQTMLQAVSTYVAVTRDRELVGIAEENLRLLERQFSDSQERFRVREITSSDLQQIETRVELGRGQLLSAQGRLAGSEAEFIQIVGAPPGTLAPPEELSVKVGSIQQAYDQADARGPVIRAAQSREKISRASIQSLEAEFGPRIDARGVATVGSGSAYAQDPRTTQLRGEILLTMPIADANLRLSRTREAREANAADWRLIEEATRQTHNSVASSWQLINTSRASLDNYRRAAEAARLAYEGALVQERAGARTTLDVLDLARDLLTVRNAFITARAEEYVARASLLAAMGMLEGPDLVPEIERYNPADHYYRASGIADLPPVTQGLFALDRIVGGSINDDRANLDPGSTVRIADPGPLPATPEPTPPAAPAPPPPRAK